MGKDNTSTSRTVAEPWSGVKDYYKDAYKDASNLYEGGAPSYYPGDTVAPLSGYTQGAIDWMANRATAGSPLTQASQNQLTQTLSGDYLNAGNPAFQGAVNAATRPVIQQYEDVVMPGLDSTFSAAGRYGSGSHQQAANQGYSDMMRNVGDISAKMAYDNYGDERTNMMRAAFAAPQAAQQDYFDINQLGTAGSMIDTQNQNLINADVEKYNYENNKDLAFLGNYMGLLGNAPWGSISTAEQPSPNFFTSALGGAAAGYGLAGPYGALAGGLLGGVGSLF